MKFIAEVYLFFYAQVIIHELCHFLAARILGLSVKKVAFGADILSVRVGKFSISPVAGGYVEIESQQSVYMNKFLLAVFLEAGPIGNLLSVLLLFFLHNNLLITIFACVGGLMFIGNNVIFFPKTDGGKIFRLFKGVKVFEDE